MVASLHEGNVIQLPSNLSLVSQKGPSFRGNVGIFSKLLISGNQYIVTLKDLRDLRDTGDDLDRLIRAVKKRKQYEIIFSKVNFINIKILAGTEKEYRNR
jgi:hypothetical protein